MKKLSKLGTILMILALSLALISCVRPASTQNDEASDAESQVDAIIRSAATQTAMAAEGSGGGASLDDENQIQESLTPEVVEATAIPTEIPATPAPISTPVEVVPNTYTIQEGEFPFCLARRFNIDSTTLLNVNGVTSGQVFYAGFEMIIPHDAAPFQGNRQLRIHPVQSYAVSSGETFNSIACLFGDLYPESIAAANGMSIDDVLTPGTVLYIP